ncbi:MAG: beta-N-acetylhexosaminidase [Marinifilaceae bacterium]
MKVVLISILLMCVAYVKAQQPQWPVPMPAEKAVVNGNFTIDNLRIGTKVDSLQSECKILKENLDRMGVKYTNVNNPKGRGAVILAIDPLLDMPEGYKLKITPKEVKISASSKAGIYYGIQSLVQMMENQQSLVCCEIADAPRFAWRGYMFDESRHFFGKDKVKEILMLMGRFKLNKFHWHLTDEPAWRVEIKGYPKLTSVGSSGTWSEPNNPKRQFYTQEDIREIIAFAACHHIEVIPEIDMPGHATAANRAYPEYSGGGVPAHPEFTFNPGNEAVYAYLTNILREVAALFPSQYIHIGGDEVAFGSEAWKKDSHVQALMKRENLSTIKDVERYFICRMADSVKTLGKGLMGWDEVLDTKVSAENTTVMWWRHDRNNQLQKALAGGYKTIMCPRRPLYFDFIQHKEHKWGRVWNGFCPVEDVYHFPQGLFETLKISEQTQPNILGMQANLWTERVHTPQRVDYMTWPRLCAMAEAAWTMHENKDYDDFMRRMTNSFTLFDSMGIYYFDPRNPQRHSEPKGCERRNDKQSMDFRD